MLLMFTKINQPKSITENLLDYWWTKIQYRLFGTGPLGKSGLDGTGFFYTNDAMTEKTYPVIII